MRNTPTTGRDTTFKDALRTSSLPPLPPGPTGTLTDVNSVRDWQNGKGDRYKSLLGGSSSATPPSDKTDTNE